MNVTILLTICFLVFCNMDCQARPHNKEGTSASPSLSRRIISRSPHIRSKIHRRFAETQVTATIARTLALQQRINALKGLLEQVNQGAYKANFKFTPKQVSDEETAEFISNHVSNVKQGLSLEISTQPPVYVLNKMPAPAITNFQVQLRNAIAKAKVCVELQQSLLKLGTRAKVNC